MSFRTVIVCAFIAISAAAAAQDDGWVQVAASHNGDDIYSIKKHTGEKSETEGGAVVLVAVGQVEHRATHIVDLNKWYVTESDCKQGYGDLKVTDIDGKFLYEAPFAEGGDSVSSAIAATLCGAAKLDQDRSKSGDLKS